jgi:hypothetical protein
MGVFQYSLVLVNTVTAGLTRSPLKIGEVWGIAGQARNDGVYLI